MYLDIRSENRKLKQNNQKKCTRCNQIYDIDFFPKRSLTLTRGYCKNCDKVRRRKMTDRVCEDLQWYCRRIVVQLKNRAKRQNIPFLLTANDLYQVYLDQQGSCYYTGTKLDFTLKGLPGSPHRNFPSVDKLTPSKGYVQGNICWCLYTINRMKNDLSENEFISVCKTVLTHRPA